MEILSPSNSGSWLSLAIVLASLLTVWALNYSAPKVRVYGTVLAALGCLAIAGWFFVFVFGSGVLENPKPHQTPLDAAKPTLLWLQSTIALCAGLFLLFVAKRQHANQDSYEILVLGAENESDRYGRVSRTLHWTIAMLFIVLIPMGIFTSMIPEDAAYRFAYYVAHKSIGVTVFLLVLVRLAWNRRSQRPALDQSLTPIERKLAHGAHIALYGMMITLPLTGYIMTSLHGTKTYLFFIEFASFLEPSDAYVIFGGFHKYLLPYLLYIILGAHVLGALKHQFIDKHDNAFKRMVS